MTEIDIEQENKAIVKQYKELLKISYRILSREDKKLIRSAFDVAVDAHKHQRRKSGEAYIFHPIAVAKIVAVNTAPKSKKPFSVPANSPERIKGFKNIM